MSKPLQLLILAVGIGVVPYPLGRIAPSSVYLALLAPVLLCVGTFGLLRGMPIRQQMMWCLLACLSSTTAFTLVIAGVGVFVGSIDLALGLVPAPFWLPWLLLFSVPPLAIRHLLNRAPRGWRWPLAVLAAFSAYILSAAVCFDVRRSTTPPDVEQPDARGREPALGPRVLPNGRLVCQPTGPSFLFSTDYSGSEWLWTVYRPLIRAWFARPGCKYYFPYDTRAAEQVGRGEPPTRSSRPHRA